MTASLRKDGQGSTGLWNYTHLTTTATTLIKSNPGVLHSITFNKPVATGTCEFDDAITNTNPMGIITTPSVTVPITLTYDIEFLTGLSITTGVAAQDITIAWA